MKTALLSLIIALGVAAFSYIQFEKYQKFAIDTESNISTLNSTVNQRFQAIDQTLSTLQQKLQSQETERKQEAQAALEGQASGQNNASQVSREEFYVFEAYRLTLLAEQNLMLGNDLGNRVANSIELLSAAKNALENVNNPHYQRIRQVLSADLQALSAVRLPDLETLWVTVGTLMDHINTLHTQGVRNRITLNNETSDNERDSKKQASNSESHGMTPLKKSMKSKTHKSSKTGDNENTSSVANTTEANAEIVTDNTNNNTAQAGNNALDNNPNQNSSGIQQSLANGWEQLKDLIKIQRHTKPVEPILSQEEQLLASEHLRLSLEQIRWAILHNNPMVYQTSIQDALSLLNTYYEPSDPQVTRFETALSAMAKINIKPELPDLKPLILLFQEQGAK